jgi:hypothetical protein
MFSIQGSVKSFFFCLLSTIPQQVYYLTLLSTLSPYIRLTAQQRDTLFTQLQQRLENHYGNQLELSYLSMMQITRKN